MDAQFSDSCRSRRLFFCETRHKKSEVTCGVCTMTFAGHTFTLTDNDKKLAFGNQTFDLSDGKKTILVKANGTAEVQKIS